MTQTSAPSLFLDVIRTRARENGARHAVLWRGGAMSWRELEQESDAIALALLGEGAARGDRAAIAAGASAEYVATMLGILKAGMSVVPLSTMSPPDVLARLLQDSGSSYIFADTAHVTATEQASGLRRVVFGEAPAWCALTDFKQPRASPTPALPELAPSDEFNLIYSSGTTGVPKGILHDHALRALQAEAFLAFGFGPTSTTIITTALYTNYSLVALFATLAGGGAVYLTSKFDEIGFFDAIREANATHAFLVPSQIRRLLEHAAFGSAAAERPMTIFSAGAPLPVQQKRELIARWPGLFVEIYGATEGGASATLVASMFPDKLGSVGRPGDNCDVRIVDDNDKELPNGEHGEIVGRSPLTMQGYLHNDDDAALTWISPEGQRFLRSGDIGYLDSDGFLYISDRKKDVIISGGLNVFASDIEDVLLQHPDVRECAVVAASSDRWGETPVAFIVTQHAAPAEEELRHWANDRLARHQKVSRVFFQTTLPRNAMGKVSKKDLRERLKGS